MDQSGFQGSGIEAYSMSDVYEALVSGPVYQELRAITTFEVLHDGGCRCCHGEYLKFPSGHVAQTYLTCRRQGWQMLTAGWEAQVELHAPSDDADADPIVLYGVVELLYSPGQISGFFARALTALARTVQVTAG